MITENLSTLKIHKLSQAQYEREYEAGNIDPNAIYLTPDEGDSSELLTKVSQLENDVGYITVDDIPDVDVSAEIGEHNIDPQAHNDIRQLIETNSGDLTSHTNSISNPHAVTPEQLGLTVENWKFTLEDGSTVWKTVYATNAVPKTFSYRSFQGQDYTYSFIESMTWEDWVNSEYNTDGFTCDGSGYVVEPGDTSGCVGVVETWYDEDIGDYISDTSAVNKSDVIAATNVYSGMLY